MHAADSVTFLVAVGSHTAHSRMVLARWMDLALMTSDAKSRKQVSSLPGSQQPPTSAAVFFNPVCANVGVK